MKDLGKINTKQLYFLWRNLSVGLLALVATLCISQILPYYLSPVIALAIAAFLYYYIYNTKVAKSGSCIMPCIAVLYSIVIYAFVTIILNLLHIWAVWDLPKEFVFFTHPFIPSLILNPVCFFIMFYIYMAHDKLKICIDCRKRRNMGGQRGAQGVLNHEAHFQLKNFVFCSAVLTIAVWAYYWIFYVDVNINARDIYVFNWLSVIGILIDELYFVIRYYNLYLDLKEGNELITQAELKEMSSKTYLRFYVVCGDYMYVSSKESDPNIPNRNVIDTPFFTTQIMNGLYSSDVKDVIEKMTGDKNGELRFFYGRKSDDDNKHSLLRYFYFLEPDKDGNLPHLDKEGEWMKFDKIKYLYSTSPSKLAELAVYDISRLATIILTEKIFDENGYRKSKIKSYNPSFTLEDVKKSNIDFHDDKWIEISLFNSDRPLFKLKKWWRNKFGRVSKR